jgi:sterol desaturase/sphingolipid hydroxylase (fatty acid hydroxylase superfamily)
VLARGAAGLIGLLLLLGWETRAPFRPLFADAGRARVRHAARNLTLAALNRAVTFVVFGGLWAGAVLWAQERHFGVLNWMGLPPGPRGLGALLVLDAWTYFWHRLNHRVPFLWRFHRMHHSDPQMDVTTASRFHLGEIVLSGCLRTPILALGGISIEELALYEGALLAVIQLHHANVALPPRLDRVLRWLIVTPALHQVHHSRERPETDSNYASILSAWDRLFGSFRVCDDARTIRFGLDELAAPEHQTLAGLLKTPLGPVR